MKVITILGIRPDAIRLSEVIKRLDAHEDIEHVLIHTGQHYSANLSDVFFKDLNIRQPDFNWGIGEKSADHLDQLIHLTTKIKENQELIKSADVVIFLGDSNSVLASVPIKKMGVKVAHIEAGMRSGDKRMFEETNRIICDHCSDFLFCYHKNYANNLQREGITKGVFVIGNTIAEVVEPLAEEFLKTPKAGGYIVVDIHRPENFQDKNRLSNIIKYCQHISILKNVDVKFLKFSRTLEKLKEFNIDTEGIEMLDLLGFKDYLSLAYNSYMVVSDSGTAQEELAFLKTPVLVPRDYTERPESYLNHCSRNLNVHHLHLDDLPTILASAESLEFNTMWMEGLSSERIVETLWEYLL